jgi:hypothetical protein
MVTIGLVLVISAYILKREYVLIRELKKKIKRYERDLD